MRMISKESKNMVYHRPECRHARKIRKANRIQMYWQDAERQGFRPCKCCDGVSYLYNLELLNIEFFSEKYNMDVDLKNDEIYVRTDVGCWKILYKKSKQHFILLHRNYVNGRTPLEEVNNAPFHRQGDVPVSYNIMKYLHYIKDHDEFKKNAPASYREMPRSTPRQRSYYYSAKRRAEKQSAKRLDNLFILIENKEGIKQLSFC